MKLPRARKRAEVTGGHRPYNALATFLDGYLGPGFEYRYGSAEDAARAYAHESTAEQRARVARQLSRFYERAQEMDEASWRAALRALGGAWQPPSLDAIEGLASILAEAVPPRYQI